MTDSQKPLDGYGRSHPACCGEASLQNRVGDFAEDIHLAGVLEELHEEELVAEDGDDDVADSKGEEKPVEAILHLVKDKEGEDVAKETDDADEGNVDLTETVDRKDHGMVGKVLTTVLKGGIHLKQVRD